MLSLRGADYPVGEVMNMSAKAAKAVRILSVPPVMAALFLVLLYVFRPDVIALRAQFLTALGCLSLFPLLAYPISALLGMRREGQRLLAMLLSSAGYLAAFVYSLLTPCTSAYRFICGTYVFSVVLLLVCNRLLGLRSSGHACSVTGPIALLCFFLGARLAPLCALVYAAVFWASVRSRRHTAGEFLWGSACCLCAGMLSDLALSLI